MVFGVLPNLIPTCQSPLSFSICKALGQILRSPRATALSAAFNATGLRSHRCLAQLTLTKQPIAWSSEGARGKCQGIFLALTAKVQLHQDGWRFILNMRKTESHTGLSLRFRFEFTDRLAAAQADVCLPRMILRVNQRMKKESWVVVSVFTAKLTITRFD